jgi:hypothetical protein
MGWTTADLLESIKNRAAVPEDQTNFPDSTLLTIADEETRSLLMPSILKYREEWMTYGYNHSLTASQSAYRLPYRAFGGKLRLLYYQDTQGNKAFPVRITPERMQEFSGNHTTSGYPTHYYMQHGSVVVEPTPTVTSGTLVMTYYRRPSELVATTAVATITAINTGTGVVTLSGVPASWVSSTIALVPYDFVRAKPEFDALAIDQTPTASGSSTTLTFSSLPTDLAVGDYVALAGKTPIPQVPADLHPILAQLVANRVLESLGFLDELKAGRETLAVMLEAAGITLQTRDEGSGLKVSQRIGGR